MTFTTKANGEVIYAAHINDLQNELVSFESGCISVSDTWAYASASTITVPTNATLIYQVGDRIRFKQGAGYKYYTVATVAATVVTVDVTTDYTVANAAITDVYYSRVPLPFGFPGYFNWLPTPDGYAVGDGTQIARFMRTGKIIEFVYQFTLGASSTVTADYSFTLPATCSPAFVGAADLADTGTAGYVGCTSSDSTKVYIRASVASGTYTTNSTTLSATVPHTWAATDVIRTSGKYFTA